ncbi:putative E3 ubiquitin-protein ligase LIN-1 isoform X3 [Argentina anserina]|uniref:putative E3 ubiquitin-protein ligase LIN-1 isoform X3 n=1 Tax=Argentina anserina TaxID=57926 RepID=UPI00217626D8|nr:putative E3 ubiquitin-protein ligase LIN-1 isoform X3 [Potentilla anserina]
MIYISLVIYISPSLSLIPENYVLFFFLMKINFVGNSMEAVASCSTIALVSSHNQERLDLKSIRAVVISINQCILKLIANAKTRNSIRVRCTSKLQNQKQDFFEFSDQSVISNLYWGIDSIEESITAEWPEEKAAQLRKAEQMLQVPALLDEDGVTAGISNSYLVCCSYFYLSVVRKLQKDEWQVALHFLQAVLVSPRLVQTEFVHDLYESLFPACAGSDRQEIRASKSLESNDKDEAIRQMTRIYRDWLMYYKVMLYGETRQGQGGKYSDILSPDKESIYYLHEKSTRLDYSNKNEHDHSLHTQWNYGKVHHFDPQEDILIEDELKTSIHISELEEYVKPTNVFNQATELNVKTREPLRHSSIKRLQDVLNDSQSDSPTSVESCSHHSAYDIESEVVDGGECSTRTASVDADFPERLQGSSSTSDQECKALSFSRVCQDPIPNKVIQVNNSMTLSRRFTNSINGLLTVSEHRDKRSKTLQNSYLQKECASQRNYRINQRDRQRTVARKKHSSHSQESSIELHLQSTKSSKSELLSITEKAISKLFHWEGLGNWDEDYAVEVTTIYQILCNKKGEKCVVLKDMILDQLLIGISASKEEKVIKVSVSILTTIVAANKSVIEDIKKKGLQLSDLASALKRNVHEAAILVYLMNPSPTEIKTLELLPALLGVVCSPKSYKGRPASLPTPLTASLMIIGVLVSSFDHATNNVHMAEISYPKVLHGLLDVARESNIEELISWATILVKCIQYDGNCRRYISGLAPMAPFSRLLECKMKHARCIALEFFHEVLCTPRSSATALLQRLQKEGSTNIMNSLMLCVQQLQPEYQLLAANLLLQLDTLDNSYCKSAFREEAMQVLLNLVASEESSTTQNLSAFILSNLGGTYSWEGEPYTVAWLVKKAGVTSLYQKNMIKGIHWLDDCLEDAGTDSWCSKIARSIINIGNPVFHSLVKGLKSTTRKVSRDCLIAIAWLGFEIAKSPESIRYSACEILLSGVEQFLHPGMELEERVLACLCIYNYASGKGMKKLTHFSEGVRESLRRLSHVTWMAEELHKVADYVLPNRSQRISCVHTQILEVGVNFSGAVRALMYYKGFLHGGYSDGSVKVWNIKGQSASLVWDMKEHKKAVTCFSLLESKDSLLSGSLDKTIRVWQVVHKKMECTEVIETKEPIRHLNTCGDMIFALTRSHGIKVFDASRKAKDICTNKKVKCMVVIQGKIYAGCKDSSIQELSTTSNRAQEIKSAAKFWNLRRRPINAVVTYKDWLYSASSTVEGSNLKEWKRHGTPQMSLKTGKREKVMAVGITEDFIYLNCSSSTNSIQIWLRGTQQKVGRISAGSRITSILTANDIILCGTEAGLIKGWIPL